MKTRLEIQLEIDYLMRIPEEKIRDKIQYDRRLISLIQDIDALKEVDDMRVRAKGVSWVVYNETGLVEGI